MIRGKRKYIIYSVILLLVLGLSVGFSAFQKQLLIDDSIFNVRLQVDTRVSGNSIQKVSGNAVSNSEDYNVKKIYGSVTFPTTSSYVLYKVDLTNYGNVKTGLLNITSNSTGINYQICDSNGNNCTNDPKTSVCNGSNCTLGSTKTIYVKVTSTSTGTKNVDLDLTFSPIHTITYENFRESTTSFKTDIMEGETYEVTLTSSPEEVSGTNATANYNSSNNKLTIAGVTNDATITAKYLATDVAQTSYTGTNPSNYVRFNNTLYRIITKETINDGYGNEELRAKIVSYNSIGNNAFDDDEPDFSLSTIKDVLNNTYYGSLSENSQELIDTAIWGEDYVGNIGLIDSSDFTSNSSWMFKNGYTVTPGSNNNVIAVISGSLVDSAVTVSRATYPTMYLSKDTLVVGGTGTSTDPYILEKKSDGIQSNPTLIKGRNLTVTGSAQPLVTVENKVGTPRYSTTTVLTQSNYTSGSTTIPTATSTGTYTIYYYIPAMDGFKAKQGSVTTKITGVTYTVNYAKGDNISEIGKTSDTCTTSGTSLTCNVTLPSITPASGWENGKWNYNSNTYNPGASFTLNSSNTGLTMTSSVTGKTYTATIYYYNGSAATSTTRTCTVSTGNSCTFTLTTAVTNSRGVYNSAYKGIASATNSMTSAALSMTQDTTFYAIYSGSVSNRYRGTSSYTTRTLYRNEFFKSNSELDVKLALSNDSAANYTPESGIGGSTWLGLSTANDTTAEYNSVETAAASTSTSLYTIYQFSITYEKGANVASIGAPGGTCKVTSATSCNVTLPTITPNTGYTSVGWSATNGATTGVTGTYTLSTSGQTLYANATGSIYTATFYYYDGSNINTTTSNCTVSNVEGNCTVSIPAAVQASSGPYGSPYKGVSATTSTMEAGSLTISSNGTKFYANYSSGDATNTKVTRYYYSSGYKSGTIYRNEYFISDSSISTVLTTADNGTTNYTSSRGPGSSNWLGLSTAQDTTPEYSTVQAAANSTNKTFYTVYQFVINYQKGSNVSAIGSDSATCNVTTSDTSCSVILPTITPNTGYTSVGWSTENGATSGQAALTTYTLTANNRVLYANAVAANYINTTTNEGYTTLSAAFNTVANNQTIKVLQDTTETTQATLASGKTGIKLDLNGKTITSSASNYAITNYGTLDIYNTSSTTGTITGSSSTIIGNMETLTLNGTSSTNKIVINKSDSGYCLFNNSSSSLTINDNVSLTGYHGIWNHGNTVFTGGSITTTNSGIDNYNTASLNISGNTQIQSNKGIINSATLVISGGTITGTSSYGIDNTSTTSNEIEYNGNTTISGGTITGNLAGIYNNSSGEINISGTTTQILTSSNDTGTGITSSNGVLRIANGTITGGKRGIGNQGSSQLFISGGTITGLTEYGVHNSNEATITGGTVTGAQYGIHLSGLLNLGTKDSNVSTSNPLIQTIGTSDYYGIYIRSGGSVNFYDGIIKSSSGTGYAINENVSDTPTGYTVYKETVSGIESAFLVSNYLNTSTGTSYPTLNEAFSAVANNQIIKVLQNTTETTEATLASGKTGIKLDLNGKTITLNNTYISNNGTLDIYNTSSATGTITGGSDQVIYNNGTLTLNGTSTTNKIIIDKTANNNSFGAISNNGPLTVNDNSDIKVSAGTSKGIYNYWKLTINGGTITGKSSGIDNVGSTSFASITINGGTITGNIGIFNGASRIMTMTGNSQVIGTSGAGISNNGTVTITSGTVTSNTTGISLGPNATLTLGTKDSTVSTSSPLIQTTGSSNNYGVDVVSGTFNFYDGIIKSSSGTGYAISGTVSDTPTDYYVTKETISGVESAYLVKQGFLMQQTSGGSDTVYFRTSIIKQNIETINFSNSLGGHSPNGTDCWDVSENQDGKVLAWSTDTDSDGLYEMTIASSGKVFTSYGVHLFAYLPNLTSINGMQYLDTSNVTSMFGMFSGCNNLISVDLSYLDTSNVTNMLSMFQDCSSLTSLDLTSSKFDTSNVTTMQYMFLRCSGLISLNLTGSNFDTSNVDNMTGMFNGCSSLTSLDLTHSNFDTSNVTTMLTMFKDCSSLTTLDLTYSNFDTSNVNTMAAMFYGCTNLAYLDLTGSNFNTSNVTNMNQMFYGCTNLAYLDLTGPNFNTSNVTSMSNMFYGCTKLVTIHVKSSFDVSNVSSSGAMFRNCTSIIGGNGTVYNSGYTNKTYARIDTTGTPGYFTGTGGIMANGLGVSVLNPSFDPSTVEKITFQPYLKTPTNYIGSWDASYNLDNSVKGYCMDSDNNGKYEFIIQSSGYILFPQNSSGMFRYMNGLTAIDGLQFVDTSNVTDMTQMFYFNTSLTSLDLSSWDTTNVTSMAEMFWNCVSLSNINVSHFDTTNVTNMCHMFSGCNSLTTLDISSFSTGNLTDSWYMFTNCENLTTIYASNSFVTSSITDSTGMFSGCLSLVGGQGTTYDSNYADKTRANIDGGTTNPGYFTDKAPTTRGGSKTLLNVSNSINSGANAIVGKINELTKGSKTNN